MPTFEMETHLAVNAKVLAHDSLSMSGVNYELGPLLRMSAPDNWYSKPMPEWPLGQSLFCSTVYILGIIPIDRHYFKFDTADGFGFKESSKSVMNKIWIHERSIKIDGDGTVVKDVIYYKSKLGIIGSLFIPIYKAIFKHRHNRLRSKY